MMSKDSRYARNTESGCKGEALLKAIYPGYLHAISVAQLRSLAQSGMGSHHARLKSEVPCTESEV